MNNAAKFWDARYAEQAYSYGTQPNHFLATCLDELSPGNILFPADGEGRNSVYAATLGWKSHCFDISIKGKEKAEKLAELFSVELNYQVGDINQVQFLPQYYDAVALIFAHLPFEERKQLMSKCVEWLKPGGQLIIEGFSTKHPQYQQINPSIGGPSEPALLLSDEEMDIVKPYFDVSLDEVIEVELHEGLYHIGKGSVRRIRATRNGEEVEY